MLQFMDVQQRFGVALARRGTLSAVDKLCEHQDAELLQMQKDVEVCVLS
jgi:hypothetical protein